jgi:hypothetical protein
MPDWAWFVLIFGAWFALQKWILPRAGVST